MVSRFLFARLLVILNWFKGSAEERCSHLNFGVNFEVNLEVNFRVNFEVNFGVNFEVNFFPEEM